jgi:plastocyanin
MKRKITYLLMLLMGLISFKSNAAIVMIEVEDFEFNPAIFTVNVGDTIMWMWDEGSHTTTSTAVPSGAASWDSPINQSSPIFMYVATVAGSYDYHCVPHSSMGMLGHFTVNSVTSISEKPSLSFIKISEDAEANVLTLTYSIPSSGNLSVRLYDIIGKPVHTQTLYAQKSGEYEQIVSTEAMQAGIYIVEIVANGLRVSRRIMIH